MVSIDQMLLYSPLHSPSIHTNLISYVCECECASPGSLLWCNEQKQTVGLLMVFYGNLLNEDVHIIITIYIKLRQHLKRMSNNGHSL